MNNPLLVGVTGGIGSGKTHICNIFERLGIPIYNADKEAKRLMCTDAMLKNEIISFFGKESYIGDEINRKHIANITFHNRNKLAVLNKLVHPAVAKDFNKWCLQNPKNKYVIKEAALLFETGSYKSLDQTVLITSSEAIKIKRIKQRDPFRSDKEIKSIIDSQWPDHKKTILADYIIVNDELNLVLPKIIGLHKKFSN